MNDGMKFEMEKEKPRHFFSVFVLDVLAKPMAKLLIINGHLRIPIFGHEISSR